MNRYEPYKKRKPLGETLFLFIATFFMGFVTFSVTGEYGDNKDEISELKDEIEKNDEEIKGNDMYKRMDDYGYTLDLVSSLISYSLYEIKWEVFLLDLASILPIDTTVKNIQYSEQTDSVILTITSPLEERLIETMREVENFSYVYDTDFTNISKEKINFAEGREQYEGFSTVLTTYIDREKLIEQYDLKLLEEENLDFEETISIDDDTASGTTMKEDEQYEFSSPLDDF